MRFGRGGCVRWGDRRSESARIAKAEVTRCEFFVSCIYVRMLVRGVWDGTGQKRSKILQIIDAENRCGGLGMHVLNSFWSEMASSRSLYIYSNARDFFSPSFLRVKRGREMSFIASLRSFCPLTCSLTRLVWLSVPAISLILDSSLIQINSFDWGMFGPHMAGLSQC